jgi:hypothetical protein
MMDLILISLSLVLSIRIIKNDFEDREFGRLETFVLWLSFVTMAKLGILAILSLNFLFGLAMFFVFWLVYQTREGLVGGADVYLVFCLASIMVAVNFYWVLLVGSVLGLLLGLMNKRLSKKGIPLGSFMLIAFWIMAIYLQFFVS